MTAARLHSPALSAVTSVEDPPSALDLMNEQVFHVEIVILTTYISVSGLLWKSNWRNYRGGGHVSEGRGLSQNTKFPLQRSAAASWKQHRHLTLCGGKLWKTKIYNMIYLCAAVCDENI